MDNRELLKHIRLFRKKANPDKLIIFVGAGVSRNVSGMPDWNALIQKMADAINYSRCDNYKKKSRGCQDICKFKDTFSTDEYLKVPQYVYNRNRKLYSHVWCEIAGTEPPQSGEQKLLENKQNCPKF